MGKPKGSGWLQAPGWRAQFEGVDRWEAVLPRREGEVMEPVVRWVVGRQGKRREVPNQEPERWRWGPGQEMEAVRPQWRAPRQAVERSPALRGTAKGELTRSEAGSVKASEVLGWG